LVFLHEREKEHGRGEGARGAGAEGETDVLRVEQPKEQVRGQDGQARDRVASRGQKFEVTLSAQSVDLLRQLAEQGIYGRSAADVGGRFIEEALRNYVKPPQLSPAPSSRRSKRADG
jgi:hypothetical protein